MSDQSPLQLLQVPFRGQISAFATSYNEARCVYAGHFPAIIMRSDTASSNTSTHQNLRYYRIPRTGAFVRDVFFVNQSMHFVLCLEYEILVVRSDNKNIVCSISFPCDQQKVSTTKRKQWASPGSSPTKDMPVYQRISFVSVDSEFNTKFITVHTERTPLPDRR